MEKSLAVQVLTDESFGRKWLNDLGVEDTDRGWKNLISLVDAGVSVDLMDSLLRQLQTHLVNAGDPGAALNNLERFVLACRSPFAFVAFADRDLTALPTLLQLITTSQHLCDLLIRNPDGYDLVRMTDGKPVARQAMVDDLTSEVASLDDERLVMAALRRFKHRETLRIAYGDIIGQQQIGSITRQISFVADAICEAALQFAIKRQQERYGAPRGSDGKRSDLVVLALGKLGGCELNYSSDIDLVILFDEEGNTDGDRPRSNREFYERVVRDFSKLLAENTELGFAYRVDLRLRPNGNQGPIVNSVEQAWQYYDVSGRTWERQAFVKARAIAGNLELGARFLKRMESWVYRRYLSRADISGIKALKRRIEQRTDRDGENTTNVKTGHGGIRDVEFVIQFLQLLNGGELKSIRTSNTLDAIGRLEQAGCLTSQESGILIDNYAFLRKVEHRLQIMFDLQTHTLPEDVAELTLFAGRMGYAPQDQDQALADFQRELQERTDLNRKILDHLLHDAFGEEDGTEPEVDLVLEPQPSDEQIKSVLTRHGFRDCKRAYQNLSALANEPIPFLSTRRCRHFLASIAPHLLEAISTTPDPDGTLVSLSQVSDSLGGKGILWELFSYNPPSLRLYVTLCASSPYLAGILTSNPGMIDELLDSLMLDRLPSHDHLEATLAELSRAAEDIDPILHSFKNAHHLTVGVRDILGKEDVRETHQALSDIAEVCLKRISIEEWNELVAKHGTPMTEEGKPCELVILALGKLGGQEPNYHSDLDVVFVYSGKGMTKAGRSEKETSNQHFFSQLAAKIIKRVTRIGPHGRLYELDPRLRPTGKSGALAVSMSEFLKYFTEGGGQSWERQALCKARPVFGSQAESERMSEVVRQAILSEVWSPARADGIREMRKRLEENADKHNLKRGVGGTVDVEFIIQMLQLKHAAQCPDVMVPRTLDAARKLNEFGFLSEDDFRYLSESYRFLRSVEARLRLMNLTARHDMPTDHDELSKLAYLLGYPSAELLCQDVTDYRRENRERFDRIFDSAINEVAV